MRTHVHTHVHTSPSKSVLRHMEAMCVIGLSARAGTAATDRKVWERLKTRSGTFGLERGLEGGAARRCCHLFRKKAEENTSR